MGLLEGQNNSEGSVYQPNLAEQQIGWYRQGSARNHNGAKDDGEHQCATGELKFGKDVTCYSGNQRRSHGGASCIICCVPKPGQENATIVREQVTEVFEEVEVRGKPQTEGGEQFRVRFRCRDDEPEEWEKEVHQEHQHVCGSETLSRPASALHLICMNLPVNWSVKRDSH